MDFLGLFIEAYLVPFWWIVLAICLCSGVGFLGGYMYRREEEKAKRKASEGK